MLKRCLCLLFVLPSVIFAEKERPPLRIACVSDGPSQRYDPWENVFRGEIRHLLEDDYKIIFPAEEQFVGDWSLESIQAGLQKAWESPDVDMVLCLGVIASDQACRYGALAKPTLAPYVVSPELQGLSQVNGTSGIPNLAYVSFRANPGRDLEVFQEIAPFRSIGFLVPDVLYQAMPEVPQRAAAYFSSTGLPMVVISLPQDAEQAVRILPEHLEAAYVAPMMTYSEDEFRILAEGLVEKGIPSFGMLGRSQVESGLLCSVSTEAGFFRTARRVALNIQRILNGEQAEDLPTGIEEPERLVVNYSTSEALRIPLPWEVVMEAEPVFADHPLQKTLSFEEVILQSVNVNLDLIAKAWEVSAGDKDIDIARSRFFPKVELSALARKIDKNRARASLGIQPEKLISANGRVQQLIFSEEAWADLDIQSFLQAAREGDYERVQADLVLASAKAYLNVLRANAQQRIRLDNLSLTRSNLDLARSREKIGAAGPNEVYRWESEIATARQAVIEANTEKILAEIQLNLLMNRPLTCPLPVAELSLENSPLLINDDRVWNSIGTSYGFRVFQDFAVREALHYRPELQQIYAQISAQERLLESKKAAFWSPTISAEANVEERLKRSGAGSFTFEGQNDRDWSLGIRASLPLFEGGKRFSEQSKIYQELQRLLVLCQSLEQQIDRDVRSTILKAGASFTNIELSREASKAARRNLALVQDAYSQGLLSLVELIDAQNKALVSELLHATSFYDFAEDLISMQRATGFFDFLQSSKEREAWIFRLQIYMSTESQA